MFDQLERARQTGGAAGGFDFLIQKFREEKNYPSMFEARLMQKRLELGLDPIQMGSLDDVPADVLESGTPPATDAPYAMWRFILRANAINSGPDRAINCLLAVTT